MTGLQNYFNITHFVSAPLLKRQNLCGLQIYF